MSSQNELLKDVKGHQDEIKNLSDKIMDGLENPKLFMNMDKETRGILTTLSKIGTTTGNVKLMNKYAEEIEHSLNRARMFREPLRKQAIKEILNRLCRTNFEVQQRNKMIQIIDSWSSILPHLLLIAIQKYFPS